jgi:exonuclease VII large subunit
MSYHPDCEEILLAEADVVREFTRHPETGSRRLENQLGGWLSSRKCVALTWRHENDKDRCEERRKRDMRRLDQLEEAIHDWLGKYWDSKRTFGDYPTLEKQEILWSLWNRAEQYKAIREKALERIRLGLWPRWKRMTKDEQWLLQARNLL